MKELHDGSVMMVEGLLPASNYYFDGVARATLHSPPRVTLEEVHPAYHLAQMIHLPHEQSGQWHATHHAFGGWPEFAPTMEYVVSVAAYSNSKEKTLKMTKAAIEYSEKLLEKEVAPRNGEFPFTL
jgi:hypothetical protein